jgi:serine/threonine-protein kinase
MYTRGDQSDDILTFDLRKNGAGARPLTAMLAPASRVVSPAGMTMAQLRRNYELILNTRVIQYPVAYQIMCEIGSGRQGAVLFALRHGARGCITEHAVKLFDPGLYRTPDEYWLDMGRIALQVGQLQHLQSPNLVLTDIYEETYGIGFVQMEAIDGLDVGRWMAPETLEIGRKGYAAAEWARSFATIFHIEGDRICLQPGVVVHIMRAVLRGLERVHALGFVHADIKPTNIMIDRLGGVKLVDFGRAARVGERGTFLLGSPLYMAPEIHRREASTIQSDCYSVGLVALEMLSGRSLGEDATTEAELLQLKMELPRRLTELLPPHLRGNQVFLDILHRFLAPDPAKRYATASEADVGARGLRLIAKQLVQADLDAEYAYELSLFIMRFAQADDKRVGDYLPKSWLRPAK